MNKVSLLLLIGMIIVFILIGHLYQKSDRYLLGILEGNYQIIEENSGQQGIWHLYIGSYQEQPKYFTIYDNGGSIGNLEKPWIVGWIESIESNKIWVRVDPDQFSRIDKGWSLKDDCLMLEFYKDQEVLSLKNTDVTMRFKEQHYAVNDGAAK